MHFCVIAEGSASSAGFRAGQRELAAAPAAFSIDRGRQGRRLAQRGFPAVPSGERPGPWFSFGQAIFRPLFSSVQVESESEFGLPVEPNWSERAAFAEVCSDRMPYVPG